MQNTDSKPTVAVDTFRLFWCPGKQALKIEVLQLWVVPSVCLILVWYISLLSFSVCSIHTYATKILS